MQGKTKFIAKVVSTTLLFVAFLGLTNCQKEEAILTSFETPIIKGEIDKSASTTSTNVIKGSLVNSNLRSDGGYAYKITIPIEDGDSQVNPNQSTLKLFENGKEIGGAHAVHNDIRNIGRGRFSHWGKTLIFSTSDNTNPMKNGRTYTYTVTNNSIVAPSLPAPSTKPSESLVNTSGLMGYAMVNGTTTGGKGGTEVTVNTLAALKSALSDNTPRIVYITGTIKGAGDDFVYVRSNKSIIGKSGAVLQGINFFVFDVSNIIIQNIKFRNYVNHAAIQIKDKAHHIWVDHCDFTTSKDRGWDYWGKDISITREADYITVSWNRFHDTHLSVLISGGIKGHESDAGKLRVTMHHNFWYNVSEREPSVNYGRVHMFNNYHLNNSGYSLGVRAGAIIRTDNEYFSNVKTPLISKINQDPAGYFSGISTNIYYNSGANIITTAESKWVPEYEYKSYLHAAKDVPTIVTNGAGPK